MLSLIEDVRFVQLIPSPVLWLLLAMNGCCGATLLRSIKRRPTRQSQRTASVEWSLFDRCSLTLDRVFEDLSHRLIRLKYVPGIFACKR